MTNGKPIPKELWLGAWHGFIVEIWTKDGNYHPGVHAYLHRIDGPAVVHDDGDLFWYINGQKHSFKSFVEISKISEEDLNIIYLKYGNIK